MPDLNDQIRRYIDGLEEPVSVQETLDRPSVRRFRVPAAVLAGAAIVLIPALVLIGLRFLPAGGGEVAQTTTVAPVTTTAAPVTTTSAPETTSAALVEVPDLYGLTVEQARRSLREVGLGVEVAEEYPSRSDFGLIAGQDPIPGEQIEAGGTIGVGVNVRARCLDYQSDLENARSTTVHVLFECAPDGLYPNVSTSIVRVEPISESAPIEATLGALLAGLTDEERAMGFSSFFSAQSAAALNSVELVSGRLIVDFNDAIIINNASTSTGGMFFMAELQANLFQFPEVAEIEFQIDGSCLAFGDWLQIGECAVWTRADWERRVAAWDAERALQPGTGDEVSIDGIVGTTFTTGYGGDPQRIMTVTGNTPDGNGLELLDSGYNEIGGWLLDDTTAADLKNWALNVTGQNAEMIWLVRSEGQTDGGSMIYTVRSVLVVPWEELLREDHGDPFLQSGAIACTLDGQSDPLLVVAAETAERADGTMAEYTNPLRAWRIDPEGSSFTEIPTSGIECLFDLS